VNLGKEVQEHIMLHGKINGLVIIHDLLLYINLMGFGTMIIVKKRRVNIKQEVNL
jgi:hypothetical protein